MASAPPLGRCVINDARLSHLIAMAFQLRSMQMLKGGPAWALGGSERFNVAAKAEDPEKTTEEQLLQMLQALLVDRFKMKFHRESEEMAGFALVVAKRGPKMEKAGDGEMAESHIGGSLKPRPGDPISINARKTSMLMLANLLSQLGQGPVVDKTGLSGTYNFKLSWDDGSGPSLPTALQEQIGLRLESQKVPVSFFVLESAQRPNSN